MATPTWAERERPILEAIASRAGEAPVATVDALAALVGMERRQVLFAVRGLVEAGYVSAVDLAGSYHPDADYVDLSLRERGRREVGQWPSENAADALLDLLRDKVEKASTPEERSRLQKFREAAAALGSKTLADIAVSWVQHYAGPG